LLLFISVFFIIGGDLDSRGELRSSSWMASV